jgi:hypothetical protein
LSGEIERFPTASAISSSSLSTVVLPCFQGGPGEMSMPALSATGLRSSENSDIFADIPADEQSRNLFGTSSLHVTQMTFAVFACPLTSSKHMFLKKKVLVRYYISIDSSKLPQVTWLSG